MSQDELGDLLGVSARYIGMIEGGKKDIEPSSALHKLFVLFESNKIPVRRGFIHENTNSRRAPSLTKNAHHSVEPDPGGNGSGLGIADVIEQVRADLDVLEEGGAAEKRRALMFLQEVHMPLLARTVQHQLNLK